MTHNVNQNYEVRIANGMQERRVDYEGRGKAEVGEGLVGVCGYGGVSLGKPGGGGQI